MSIWVQSLVVTCNNICCHVATDLEWKLIYVGSAEDETYDQLLESVLVGPVNVGNYRFVLQARFINTNLFNFLLPLTISYKFKLINTHSFVSRQIHQTRPRFVKKI
jgi:hypothetical protein